MGVEQPSRGSCHGGVVKTRCLLRRGLGRPWFPSGLAGAGEAVAEGQQPVLPPNLTSPPPHPTPLHSPRQAAIGLLLHDCPLHGVPRPSCLQQSLKFLQPNLSPFLPAVNALESTAVYPRRRLLLRCCHHQHHYQANRGSPMPRSLVSKDKDGPVLMVQPHIPPSALPTWYWPNPTDHSSCWGQAYQLYQGVGALCRNTPGSTWSALPVSGVPEPGCSISATTPFPSSPIPDTHRVGRRLGQASACDSQGHKSKRWIL